MAKRVIVQTELATEELHSRYRNATNAVERTHWQILWLMKEGHTPDEIASVLAYTARWVRTIVQRWNAEGEPGIRDQRRTQPGAPCLLPASQQQELDHALDQPPADGGLWSGPKVATWMAERLGRLVGPRRGWDYLQRLEVHVSHDRSMRRATKPPSRLFKKLPGEVEKLQEKYPEASIELWSQDERCRWLQAHPEMIRGRTSFHWWPALDTP
jgi:transposase